ncbi:natterin-3-like [Labeo rohita]|uniref:natterin-3-like n=1 Tax=Labeo rohita TaxID=84645 RepID=UPI0021E32758|nr:natterin-3-like [Labeo rohita]
MMDFNTRIMFALMLICLQLAGGDFSSSVEEAEPSKSPHQLHRRRLDKAKSDETKKENAKNVIQSATDHNSNLEWVASAEVPKDAVSVKAERKDYYITKRKDCEICFFDKEKSSCVIWSPKKGEKDIRVSYNDIMFLVNKDNFEMMEWKKCTNRKIPPMSVEICDGHFIAKNEVGFTDMTIENVTETTEVLTLNTDIKKQHVNIIEYLMSSVVMAENLEVLKHFQASNRNCKPSKQTMKFDHNIDKTIFYQTGHTHTFGVNAELTINATLPSIAKIGGKFGLKYVHSRPRSNTTSEVEKTLHSVDMAVEVPPNHSCTIDLMSNTFMAEVPFTGEMTRMYKNNEIRKTSIKGTYVHQEVTEIQTLVNPCQPFLDGKKC